MKFIILIRPTWCWKGHPGQTAGAIRWVCHRFRPAICSVTIFKNRNRTGKAGPYFTWTRRLVPICGYCSDGRDRLASAMRPEGRSRRLRARRPRLMRSTNCWSHWAALPSCPISWWIARNWCNGFGPRPNRGRADDTEDTIRTRMRVYEEQTKPLLDYYQQRGLVVNVDGLQSREAVQQALRRVIEQAA